MAMRGWTNEHHWMLIRPPVQKFRPAFCIHERAQKEGERMICTQCGVPLSDWQVERLVKTEV